MRYHILLTHMESDDLDTIVRLAIRMGYSLLEPVIHDRWEDETFSISQSIERGL
jgi:hypothetical protein